MKFNLPRLYNLALQSVVNCSDFDIQNLDGLPGFVKEDLLRIAVLRGKCQGNISFFLHPNLRKLDISECKITCEELENISHCNQLRVLEMNPAKYHRFTHPSLVLEGLFSHLHNLVKLHIQRNDGMTDCVTSLLAIHCPGLQELDVCGCTYLTDESAKYLSTLSYIRAINLSDTSVGDFGLVALSNGNSCKSLSELKLNNCIKISDVGINALVDGCKVLSILVFCGCPKVSVDCQLALGTFLGKDRPNRAKLLTWTVYF